MLYALIYVDDILVILSCKKKVENVIDNMDSICIKNSWLCELVPWHRYFQKCRGMHICQSKYVNDLLQRIGL